MLRLNPTDEELMIRAVQKRPPLWDFSLPLTERNKDITAKLWQEVSDEIQGMC